MSIYTDLQNKSKSLSVTGLGYVGLPLALEFAKHFHVIAFDINAKRVEMMRNGRDPSNELLSSEFENVDITFTSDPSELQNAHFHIVAVPTDIDAHQVPNLAPLKNASKSVGAHLKPGDYVIYESTVFPGCTEEICLPELEQASGLRAGIDFKLGYSPERIVPGDRTRTLTNILKIVGAQDIQSTNEIAKVYGQIITAGIHKTSSIKVAEAAKVIENTQRDLNISLMNELAMIFDTIGIETHEVLEAAGTKWNFHKYFPGLVGGHCISVDPFYLLHKARQLGHEPEVIAAGRRVNDEMPEFIASRLAKSLIELGKNPGECKVLVMGITFKENVSDIRNSKVVDLIRQLESYSMKVDVIDPHADAGEVQEVHAIKLHRNPPSKSYDAIVATVKHDAFAALFNHIGEIINQDGVVFDIKGAIDRTSISDHTYWRL